VIRRALLFAAIYAALLALVAASGLWRPVDYWLFGHFFLREAPPAFDRLILVDVPYDRRAADERDFAVYRARVGAVLESIAASARATGTPPQAVVLDVAFTKPSDDGVKALVRGIAELRRAAPTTPIFGAIIHWKENTTEIDPDYAQRHIAELYDRLDAAGHTAFEQHGPLLKYEASVRVPSPVADVSIPALPVVLANRLFRLGARDAAGPMLVPLGPAGAIPARVARFEGDGSRLAQPLASSARDFDAALVVLGTFAHDLQNPYGRPGPELLGWALSDLAVHSRDRVTREPLNHPGFLVAEVLGLSLLALAVFHALLRWRLASARRPEAARRKLWKVALGAWGAGLALAAALAGAFLLAERIIPVALALVGVSAATALAWLAADEWLGGVVGDPERFMRVFPQRFRYDVFVSYSREPSNAAWVEKEVVAKLAGVLRPDGTPLRIFFDRSEISAGERWEDKILSSLAAARVFLPVYSPDYFEKAYCRLECEMVSVLQHANRGPLLWLGVAHDAATIPEGFQGLQYVDASANPDFIAAVASRVTALLEPVRVGKLLEHAA
jgi:hypothetical protein